LRERVRERKRAKEREREREREIDRKRSSTLYFEVSANESSIDPHVSGLC
jgi:hypothetical protein